MLFITFDTNYVDKIAPTIIYAVIVYYCLVIINVSRCCISALFPVDWSLWHIHWCAEKIKASLVNWCSDLINRFSRHKHKLGISIESQKERYRVQQPYSYFVHIYLFKATYFVVQKFHFWEIWIGSVQPIRIGVKGNETTG